MRKAFETGASAGKLVNVCLAIDTDGYYIGSSTDRALSTLKEHFSNPDIAGKDLVQRLSVRRGVHAVRAVVLEYPSND